MTPRALHVLDSLAPGDIQATFLEMLRVWRQDPSMHHEVLAFTAGELEPSFTAAAQRLTVTDEEHEIAALLEEGFWVVHLLTARCAHRLAPMLVARSNARIVYAKGYDVATLHRMRGGFEWEAEQSLMAACDAVTFTTAALAAEFPAAAPRACVLDGAAPVTARLLDVLRGTPRHVHRGVM